MRVLQLLYVWWNMTKLCTAFVTTLFFSIIGHSGCMTGYCQSNCNIIRLFSVEDVCAKSLTTNSSIFSMGDPFYSALQTYLNQDPLFAKKHSQLKTYLSEFAIDDLDDLVIKFGSDSIQRAIQRFPPSSLLDLLHSHGEEF
ncbi:hypothetical protein [Desulforhopalus sp. IMCC35007]|uniref:hypothetical protein n=1 Tax=Desulforhopalus sp. IMCC35007 TaxID=2569543 RepID=UPI0010ADFD17|nr:hypothetical protein [Desulforhopalus sp. IMCC35007]TKB06089.1 hypothetical protein FCL48_22180 [Desulforhopalus sp. IMCC35007]